MQEFIETILGEKPEDSCGEEKESNNESEYDEYSFESQNYGKPDYNDEKSIQIFEAKYF